MRAGELERRSPSRGLIPGQWILLAIFLLVLAGCAAEPTADELPGAGSPTAEAVVLSFLEDLNDALAARLDEPTVRRAWAETLASHFAPSERVDQRAAFSAMLAEFAASAASPAVGSRATLEVTWSGTAVLEEGDGRALVRVVDGVLTLRFLDADGEVLRERTAGLTEVIGQTSEGLPTLQVGGSWFMTEG